MNNNNFIVIALVFTSLSPFIACKNSPVYPELNVSVIDSLQQTDIPGVFIAGSNKVQPRPPQVSMPCPRLCASTVTYEVKVTYPIWFCYPVDITSADELFADREVQDSLPVLLTKPVTHSIKKLSKPNYRGGGMVCGTYAGPWYAEIVDSERCDNSCGEGTHDFSMVILGIPVNVSWSWSDSMDNRPQDVNYVGEPYVISELERDCDANDLTDCN